MLNLIDAVTEQVYHDAAGCQCVPPPPVTLSIPPPAPLSPLPVPLLPPTNPTLAQVVLGYSAGGPPNARSPSPPIAPLPGGLLPLSTVQPLKFEATEAQVHLADMRRPEVAFLAPMRSTASAAIGLVGSSNALDAPPFVLTILVIFGAFILVVRLSAAWAEARHKRQQPTIVCAGRTEIGLL